MDFENAQCVLAVRLVLPPGMTPPACFWVLCVSSHKELGAADTQLTACDERMLLHLHTPAMCFCSRNLSPWLIACCAALVAEEFMLLQLYADQFKAGEALARVLKTARQKLAKQKSKAGGTEGSQAPTIMTAEAASDVVMVAASALWCTSLP